MGGEKNFSFCISNLTRGSPPHGRGKVRTRPSKAPPAGITPAWAGKSSVRSFIGRSRGDHPRMGGEKIVYDLPIKQEEGSPPHGRGKVIVQIDAPRPRRITPAWAGKRAEAVGSQMSTRDHPRMGGEKPVPFYLFVFGVGSPPHGRGKANLHILAVSRLRITPAWAGKSRTASHPSKDNMDHPRMGGEKTEDEFLAAVAKGSPPHGRGKGKNKRALQSKRRITPAWAGKSGCRPAWVSGSGDHPRMGGEKILRQILRPPVLGSPPHGRGKAALRPGAPGPPRITPAWAGKSHDVEIIAIPVQDHPRMGGEKIRFHFSGDL